MIPAAPSPIAGDRVTQAPKPTRKKAKPKPTTKGFSCPDCRGVRLHTTHTTRPIVGMVRRYRKCSACGLRITTEERIAKAVKSK